MSSSEQAKHVMCVHTSYAPHRRSNLKDMVCASELHLFEDGTIKKNLRLFESPKRDFYVTKPSFKNHKSKKEWEKLNRLNKFRTTQNNLLQAISKALNVKKNKPRVMARSPYLYGSDVHIKTIIAHKYIETYGSGQLLPEVGVMDYEWDIATKKPTIGTYVYEDQLYITVRKDMIENCNLTVSEFKTLLHEGYKTHCSPILDKFFSDNPKIPRKDYNLHLEVVDLDLDVFRKLFKFVHQTRPNYLTFWNGISDLEIILGICDEYMVDPSTFMNDPCIPDEYRYTKLLKGPTETIDANGNKKPKMNSEQWHVLDNMAYWQFIDIMCSYHTNRAHKPNLPSYAFNFVIPREIQMKKLKLVEELDHLEESDIVAWHNRMSKERIVEYSLYALFDVILPQLLEEKSFEIRAQAYSNLTYHPIGDFKKNPRKLCNAQHFSFLEMGYAVGSTGDKMRESFDDLIYGSNNWIITLNSSYHDTLDTPLLEDSTSSVPIIPNDADGDLTSSYPSNQRLLNISRATTVTEVIKVDGIPEELMRELGLDISSHGGNSIDFCVRLLGLPHLDSIVADYIKA